VLLNRSNPTPAVLPAAERGAAVLLCLLLIWGCGKRAPESPVLARVGDNVLTLAEARAHIDTSFGSRTDELRRYIGSWVDAELLYQEAKRKGLEHSDAVESRLGEVRRQIANQAYLEQFVYPETASLAEDSLRSYFTAHAGEFFLPEDEIQVNLATFDSRERASRFGAAVAQGTPWAKAIEPAGRDSAGQAGFVSSLTNRFYTLHTIVPATLWKVAQTLGANEVSFPVRTDAGFVVLQLLKTYRQGTPAAYELARDEVYRRVSLERQRQRYDKLLSTLRNRYSVQLYYTSFDSVAPHE